MLLKAQIDNLNRGHANERYEAFLGLYMLQRIDDKVWEANMGQDSRAYELELNRRLLLASHGAFIQFTGPLQMPQSPEQRQLHCSPLTYIFLARRGVADFRSASVDHFMCGVTGKLGFIPFGDNACRDMPDSRTPRAHSGNSRPAL